MSDNYIATIIPAVEAIRKSIVTARTLWGLTHKKCGYYTAESSGCLHSYGNEYNCAFEECPSISYYK